MGGSDDPGDPAVVAFEVAGLVYCSGALVGPRTVLTAGHCANLIGTSDKYAVDFGPDATAPTRKVTVLQQVTHPSYTAEGAPYDFALLQLAEPVTGVDPLPIATAPMTQADVGTLIRHVGYGISDENAGTGEGTKRTATYPITEVDPLIIWSVGPGEQTCTGDSGGPGFTTLDDGGEVLAAVVSDGPNCHDAGWDGRVDVVADWIVSTRAVFEPDAGPVDAGVDFHPDAGSGDSKGGGCESFGGLELVAIAMALAFVVRFRAARS
ncbi:MAG: trypsin-like serine protease [Deltaproteobacteria bacterium]|nr:trypsin-like serine protease [Deltaproteobacteria bacterium]